MLRLDLLGSTPSSLAGFVLGSGGLSSHFTSPCCKSLWNNPRLRLLTIAYNSLYQSRARASQQRYPLILPFPPSQTNEGSPRAGKLVAYPPWCCASRQGAGRRRVKERGRCSPAWCHGGRQRLKGPFVGSPACTQPCLHPAPAACGQPPLSVASANSAQLAWICFCSSFFLKKK